MKSRQGQGGGAKRKLQDGERAEIVASLQGKDFWHLEEIVKLIGEQYDVWYSQVWVRKLLKSWGMYHYKPEPLDYRRKANAEDCLFYRLQAVGDAIKLWGWDTDQIAFGFADESSPQANSNQTRLWSFYRKTRKVNSDKKLRHNTFGFYALQGNSLVQQINNSKAETFLTCLRAIRRANREAKACVVLWDNLPSHCKREVEQAARQLQIILVNLPAYAPDLNPIERIWKQIKRRISYEGFIQSKEQLHDIIVSNFQQLASKLSFAQKWIEDFFKPVFQKCPISL